MLQKLSKTDPPYLTYEKHHGAALTDAGKQAALKILRRHRLIELYLVEALNYTWDEVHKEAEMLEHALSPLLEERIDAALGFPQFDPHGDPIPDAKLHLPQVEQITLNSLAVGKIGRIARVPHDDAEILRYLGKSGLRPGRQLKLIARTPYDQTMRIQILDTGQELIIGPELGEQISILIEA
jgi:DtxR family Mn-dependent transcriptional regulator